MTDLALNPPRHLAARARWATLLVFFLNGLSYATWALLIPSVRDALRLSPGLLGLALLSIPVGSLISMPLTGGLVARWGSRAVTLAGATLLSLALPLPVLAPGFGWLLAALGVFGFANGMMDVAMNAQGVAVERALARPVLSGLHAAFSFGGLVGAGAGSLLIGAGLLPLPQVLGVAALVLLGSGLAATVLLPTAHDHADQAADEAAPAAPSSLGPLLLLLGGLCFLSMLGEGAVADWSALYLRDDLGAGAGLAGLAFTAFSLTMALSRVFGDLLRARLGDARMVPLGALLGGVGLLLATLTAWPWLAAVGFAAFGLGIANVVPVLYGAGGRAAGGRGIAQVATVGYLGFMVGPPLIGALAQVSNLRLSLAVVAVLTALIAVVAPRVLRRLG